MPRGSTCPCACCWMRSSPTAAAASSPRAMSSSRELLDVTGVDRVRRPTRPRSSRPAARAAPTTIVGPVEPSCALASSAEQVLHVVAVLVRDHVGLRERATLRAELRLELVEEAEIDVHALIGRAVERSDRRRRRAAPGVHLAGEERRRSTPGSPAPCRSSSPAPSSRRRRCGSPATGSRPHRSGTRSTRSAPVSVAAAEAAPRSSRALAATATAAVEQQHDAR